MLKKAVATCLFWLLFIAVNGQQQRPIEFLHFSTEWVKIDKGLSQNSVFTLLQDRDGFMWFGTWDGLNKFDGYQFTIFRPHKYAANSNISNETVRCLYDDKDGFLWVGTEEGLNRLNRYSLEFRQYKKDVKSLYAINSDTILSITGDDNDFLYIGTNKGVNIFDKKTESFFNIDLTSGLNNAQTITKVNTLCLLDKAFLWIGTDNGIFNYDLVTGEMKHYGKLSNSQLVKSDTILSIVKDTYGFLWIASRCGVAKINLINNEVKQYYHEANNPKSLSLNYATDIFADSKGNLWIGTSGGGVNLYNYKEDNFSVYQNNAGKEKSLGNDYVNDITEDKYGNIWIATSKGVNRIDNYANTFNQNFYLPGNSASLNNNTVWTIFENDDGKIWIGTDGGVNILDRTTNKFSYLTCDKNNNNSLSSNQIRSIFKDSYGDYWIGTFDEGVNRYNPGKKKFTRYKADKANGNISDNQVWSIAEDRNKDIWMGTLNGLVKYDRANDKIIKFYHDEKNSNSLSNNLIYNLYVDSKGYLWISTLKGLNKLNVKNMTFTSFFNDPNNMNTISNNRIFSVYEDKQSIFWIATMGGGLNRYNPRNNVVKIYTENEGLSNNIVYNILEDNSGNLWLSTNFGLSRFNKNTETFVNYDIQDGIQSSEFNLGAACKTKNGEFLFGGMNGYNIFSPDKFVENQQQPDITITAFKVFNKPHLRQYKNRDAIKLSYYDNFFSFEFAALDFTNPNKIKYAYKLEHFDKDWIYTDASHRFAEYTNVPPGLYIFRVKATNSQGNWSKDDVKLYLIIKNVWWRTWWFRGIVLMSFLLIIFVFVYDKLQKARKKHIWEKQKLNFERQVFELRQKALSLQMNPHFIFNTLNSIQNFILKNNIDQALQFMGKLSQLMRLILTGTREEYVPMINEIKILSHYLDLEKIRFNDKFEYSIQIDNAIDSDFMGVPPMLVQPFVENALLHGIMHKKEKGNIRLTFTLMKGDILCVVEDDGVGREVAAKIQKESGLGHSSRGIAITADRLSLFDEKNLNKKRIIINDRLDDKGLVVGTRVEVLLPFIEM